MVRGMATALAGLGLAAAIVAACSEGISIPKVPETPSGVAAHGMAHNQIGGVDDTVSSAHIPEADLAKLRQLTLPYADFAAAQDAQYTVKLTDCFSDPTLGGMGFHFGRADYINDPEPDASKPEVLLYVPQKNGALKFVGVEYIVPFDLWTHADPPQLFGISFHRIEAFKVWALHAWIWTENSSGIFTDFNPKVSCQFAG